MRGVRYYGEAVRDAGLTLSEPKVPAHSWLGGPQRQVGTEITVAPLPPGIRVTNERVAVRA